MILFILKRFYDYNSGYGHQVSNGLKTSALFVVDLLRLEGFKAKLVEAIDGNCIDRLVTENKPRIVVLEAVWVTPDKLRELRKLHPKVRFVVRIHSETPFLANEGMVVKWLKEYTEIGVEVSFNSLVTRQDFEVIFPSIYLPNYYPVRKIRHRERSGDVVDVGCFGAIRPLKNQLIQCLAAIRFAKHTGRRLRFHMNGTRAEQGGNENLKNITSAMNAAGEELVLHPWLDLEEFLDLVGEMDYCMQVSLSESFNLTAANAVSMGVPLIGSSAIRWLPKRSQAPVDNSIGIAEKLEQADRTTVVMNHAALESYLSDARVVWERFALE